MVHAGLLVGLAVGRPYLLFQAVRIGRAAQRVDQVAAFAIRVAEHRVHGVDAVFHWRVGIGSYDAEPGLAQDGDVRLTGVHRLA
ncbi:hypothetical protein D3C76_1626810 [compost metagenome]